MNERDLAEQAFKNGYKKGVGDTISDFKDLVLNYVQERDLLLVAFKNALDYAETELKRKLSNGY